MSILAIKRLWSLPPLRASNAKLLFMVATSDIHLLHYRMFPPPQKVPLDSATLGIGFSCINSLYRRTDMTNWLLICFLVLTRTSHNLEALRGYPLRPSYLIYNSRQLSLLGMKNVTGSGERASHGEIWKSGGTPATLFKGFLFTSATKALWKKLVFYYQTIV